MIFISESLLRGSISLSFTMLMIRLQYKTIYRALFFNSRSTIREKKKVYTEAAPRVLAVRSVAVYQQRSRGTRRHIQTETDDGSSKQGKRGALPAASIRTRHRPTRYTTTRAPPFSLSLSLSLYLSLSLTHTRFYCQLSVPHTRDALYAYEIGNLFGRRRAFRCSSFSLRYSVCFMQ
jgi:hypothetical protein